MLYLFSSKGFGIKTAEEIQEVREVVEKQNSSRYTERVMNTEIRVGCWELEGPIQQKVNKDITEWW